MSLSEGLKPTPPKEALTQELNGIQQLIKNLLGGRRAVELSFSEQEEVVALRRKEDVLIIQALEMRRDGDRSIQVRVEGRKDESFHEFSQNRIHISINSNAYIESSLVRRFDVLQEFYSKGNLADLINDPDEYIKDPPTAYMFRTIYEALNVGNALDKATNINRRTQLNVLKVSLAERVLQARADGEVGKGAISVVYEKRLALKKLTKTARQERKTAYSTGDTIMISYALKGVQGRGFHILTPDRYPFHNNIAELVELGGGYDRVSTRRKQ